jgi:Pretoxin HINT domain
VRQNEHRTGWCVSKTQRTLRLLNLPELGVLGLARVTAIEPCPPLADGDGSVITGRFTTREVASTVRAILSASPPHEETGYLNDFAELGISATDDIAVLEGTSIHPIWSLDRQDWIELGHLEPGERLQGTHGPVTVESLTVHSRPQTVYNIEVHGHHVYQVAELGVLVHNAGGQRVLT